MDSLTSRLLPTRTPGGTRASRGLLWRARFSVGVAGAIGTVRPPRASGGEMQVTVNGKKVHLEREMSISDFLRSKGIDEVLVAVEHNSDWVGRTAWPDVVLREDDRLEVVRIMAGG